MQTDPTETPILSVVVPHFNDLKRLDLCLAALARQTFPREHIEVVVADNGSSLGSDAVAFVIAGRARLVTICERGAGPARNGGAAAARGEILAFTDCDCLPEAGWLAAGVEALSRFDVVGGRMTVMAKDVSAPTPAEAFELVFAFDNETYVRRKGFSVSANLFCARSVFEAVGGFGVGLSEDVDWCRRATARGYRLGYEPLAEVAHPARVDWTEIVRKWRRINSESFELIRLEPFGKIRWWVRTLLMPISALAHVPRVLFSRDVRGLDQRIGALKILFALRAWRTWDCIRLAATAR